MWSPADYTLRPPLNMLWGLFQSIFSGLSVDLKVYKKEIANDARKGYSGYSGSIDYVNITGEPNDIDESTLRLLSKRSGLDLKDLHQAHGVLGQYRFYGGLLQRLLQCVHF